MSTATERDMHGGPSTGSGTGPSTGSGTERAIALEDEHAAHNYHPLPVVVVKMLSYQ